MANDVMYELLHPLRTITNFDSVCPKHGGTSCSLRHFRNTGISKRVC